MEYTKGETAGGWVYVLKDDMPVALVHPKHVHKFLATPAMYEACRAQHEAIDLLFALLIAKDKTFFPSKSGKPWEAIIKGNKAIAEADGK